jgi:hypothetical protein
LNYFFARYHITWVLLDFLYTTPERLRIEMNIDLIEKFGSIAVFQVRSLSALETAEQSAPSLSLS